MLLLSKTGGSAASVLCKVAQCLTVTVNIRDGCYMPSANTVKE